MSGPIGLLFREFAVVVSLSILVSAVVSLTVVPMLCSRFLPKPGVHAKEYEINKKFDRFFDWMLKTYIHFLDLALKNRKKVLWGAISTFVITVVLFIYSPKGFFPEEDIGQIQATEQNSEAIKFMESLFVTASGILYCCCAV